MNTKKIREALAAMRSCIKSGEPWTSTMETVYNAAGAELEAIEQELLGASSELMLAAQHKSNPGSTNGTLIQVANSLRRHIESAS